jgi:hypothetical protein
LKGAGLKAGAQMETTTNEIRRGNIRRRQKSHRGRRVKDR